MLLASALGAGIGAKKNKDARVGGAMTGGGIGLLAGASAGLVHKNYKKVIEEAVNHIRAKRGAKDIFKNMQATNRLGFTKKTHNPTIYAGRSGAKTVQQDANLQDAMARRKRVSEILKDKSLLSKEQAERGGKTFRSANKWRVIKKPSVTEKFYQKYQSKAKPKVFRQTDQRKRPIQGLDLKDALEEFKARKGMNKQSSLNKLAFTQLLVGAGLGAIGGAITAPKGHRLKGAIMGAGFGALSGGVGGGLMGAGRSMLAGGGRAAVGQAFKTGLGKATIKSTVKNVATDTALTTGLNALTGAYKPQTPNMYDGQFKTGALSTNKRLALGAGTVGLAHGGRHLALLTAAKDASKIRRGARGTLGFLGGASILPAAYLLNKKSD